MDRELIEEARAAAEQVKRLPRHAENHTAPLYERLADALESAQPRTIESVEELDALPVDSVVVDFAGCPRTKRYGDSYMAGGWTAGGRSPISSAMLADGHPMTVVFVPREETTP